MLGLQLGGVLLWSFKILIPFTPLHYIYIKDLQAELSELNVKGARSH